MLSERQVPAVTPHDGTPDSADLDKHRGLRLSLIPFFTGVLTAVVLTFTGHPDVGAVVASAGALGGFTLSVTVVHIRR